MALPEEIRSAADEYEALLRDATGTVGYGPAVVRSAAAIVEAAKQLAWYDAGGTLRCRGCSSAKDEPWEKHTDTCYVRAALAATGRP